MFFTFPHRILVNLFVHVAKELLDKVRLKHKNLMQQILVCKSELCVV